ncbi:MAG TPA: hypothetical protein VJ600_03900 [Holophagaceae bacterium]|nr:hypothetical protein [Holophagaceae bacterium]
MIAPYEFRLLETLRRLPAERQPGMARACTEMVLLAERSATCPGPGVDGFSCGSPITTCEQCREFIQAFQALAD